MADALKIPFATEATVDRIADLYREPDWMRADRHAALKLFSDLPPVEGVDRIDPGQDGQPFRRRLGGILCGSRKKELGVL